MSRLGKPGDGGDNSIEGGLDIKISKPRGPREVTAVQKMIAEQMEEPLTPQSIDDIPGLEIAEGLGLTEGTVKSLPESVCADWRFVSIKINCNGIEDKRRNYKLAKEVAAIYEGKIASVPFSGSDEMELILLFPSDFQARNATIGMRGQIEEITQIGVQQQPKQIIAGMFNGAIVFPGSAVDSAREEAVAERGMYPSSENRLFKDEDIKMGRASKEARVIPSTFTSVGYAVEIRTANLGRTMTPDQQKEFYKKIYRIFKIETDRFQWLGNSITILTTRERGGARLATMLQEVLNDYPKAAAQVIISEGKLQFEKIGEDGKMPRIVKGELFENTRNFVPDKARGIFVATESDHRSISSPRGLKVSNSRKLENGGYELIDFEERDMEIMTGGPREMLGRENEYRTFLQKMSSLRTVTKNPEAMFVQGEPGIGKSRFLEEMISYFKKHGIVYNVAKSEEDEKTKQYSTVKKLIKGFVANFAGGAVSEDLAVLKCFIGEGDWGGDISAKAEALYENPEQLTSRILKMIGTNKPYAILADDLQWCDSASAIAIASLIRATPKRVQLFLGLSSRNDVEKIPLVIRQAVEERGVESVGLGRLKFITQNESNQDVSTDLLEQYILKSMPVDPNVPQSLPESFKIELARMSEGIPFALTQMLTYLQNEGLLYVNDRGEIVVEEDKIVYKDLTLKSLVENRFGRMTEEEQKVIKAITLFGGSISRDLFERLLPQSFVDAAEGLEKEGWLSMDPVRMQHDLIREAAADKFPPDPALAWSLYGIVSSLAGGEAGKFIDDEVLFKLISPMLESEDGKRLGKALYDRAMAHGVRAIENLGAKRRTEEGFEIATQLLDRVPAAAMQGDQRLSLLMNYAKLGISVGINPDDIERRLGESVSLTQNLWKRMEIAVMMCDSLNLRKDSSPDTVGRIRSAALRLEGAVSTLMPKLKELPPEAQRQLFAMKYLAMLNLAKADYKSDDFESAEQRCKTIIEEISGLMEIPIELERVLVETSRYYGNTISVKEMRRRGELDDDSILLQSPHAQHKRKLLEGKLLMGKVVKSFRSDRPLLRNPKDLIGALRELSNLVIFTGGEKSEGLALAKEALREAANYGEVEMAGYQEKLCGNILTAIGEAGENPIMNFNRAITEYTRGLAEITRISPDKNHRYATYIRTDRARAIALLGEATATRKEVPEDVKRKIEQGWEDACRSFKELWHPQYPQNVFQYVLPTMGKLLILSDKLGITLDRSGMPDNLTELARSAATMMYGKVRDMHDGNNYDKGTEKVLQWKVAGLESLGDTTAPRDPSDTPVAGGLELDTSDRSGGF